MPLKMDPFELLGRLCARMVDDLNPEGHRAGMTHNTAYTPIKLVEKAMNEEGLELVLNRQPTPDMARAMQYKFGLANSTSKVEVQVSIRQRGDEHYFLVTEKSVI